MKILYSYLAIILSAISLAISKDIEIFNNNFTVKFTEVIDVKFNLTELLQNNTEKYKDKNPFLNIIATLQITDECKKTKQGCNNPIVLYGKLNSPPEPGNLLFDVKDDIGQIKEQSISYGFEFTPCQYKESDILYVKIVGSEGKTNFTLTANYNIITNYKVYCPNESNSSKVQPPIFLHPSVVQTEQGTIYYGGKSLVDNSFNTEIYLLNNNIEWEIISISQKSTKPAERYGALMKVFENYLIIFGGKNKNEESLNDLWVFDLNTQIWSFIDYNNSTNIPTPKFLPSGEYIENYNKIVIFGGEENYSSSVLYFLNLGILNEIIIENNDFSKINYLWTLVNTSIQPKQGLSIIQISENEILFFGGFDISNIATRSMDILNLNKMISETITPSANSIFPSPRAFHSMINYGKILILYGGEDSNKQTLNDIWKFIISSRTWVPIEQNKENQFFLYRSSFFFIKIGSFENPVIFGGKNRNNEATNDLIKLEFDLCLSDESLISNFSCLPCSEGYQLVNEKCVICSQGTYHNIYSTDYTNSKCESCPIKTYNKHKGKRSISSCELCSYGFYNSIIGQKECSICPIDELCLPGSSQPTTVPYLISKVKDFHLKEENYPDFISSNRKIKDTWQYQGFIGSIVAIVLFMIIIAILAKVFGRGCHKILISCDFLPITGGIKKKINGGVLFLLYLYFNIILILTFILRFVYYNELTEVIPISSSHGTPLKSSFTINVDLIGYEDTCIDSNQRLDDKYHSCSSNLNIQFDSLVNVEAMSLNKNNIRCLITQEGQCRVNVMCENCNFEDKSLGILFKIKSETSYIQAYYWTFEMTWGETLDKKYGYSQLEGIFKPDENLNNNYLFSGNDPSAINIFLTPIYFSRKSDNTHLQGYRLTFNSYERGSITNNISKLFNNDIGLDIKINISASQYEINVWKQIAILDFYAFILGMFAGLSFITRILKNTCERLNIGNESLDEEQMEVELAKA